jgi:hypothetical protein
VIEVNEVQFFQTKMGRQFFETTMPELVRQLHRMNDLLALGVELMEKNGMANDGGGTTGGATSTTGSKK